MRIEKVMAITKKLCVVSESGAKNQRKSKKEINREEIRSG
jgi:hypothetical protein